ncbi:hypothetical protein [Micromonospora carbonacea]|uniref:hypothetical protein n=1 Tax=Micromonospora carbonacea TaxID=47853 RepID=UPI00371B0CE7
MTGTRRDTPSRHDPTLSGLEVWLTGTRAELRAATTALTGAGCVIWQGTPRPLTGTDTGRFRLYLRLSVTADRPTTGRPAPGTDSPAALIDLNTARATRRPA